MGANEDNYKYWYNGNKDKTNSVATLKKLNKAESVIEIDRFSDRLMSAEVIVGSILFNIYYCFFFYEFNIFYCLISMKTPQVGKTAQENAEFRNKLGDKVARFPQKEGLIMAGDVIAYVDNDRVGFEEMMRLCGFGKGNNERYTVCGNAQKSRTRNIKYLL